MALAPGTRLGPYAILSALGAGGMGEVYRARDAKLSRDVAIKILPDLFASDPDRLARFEREAKTLAALNHPNIAHIHGLEDSTGVPALVMELVEGPTLADRVARGPIPIDEALPIAKQITEALESAHEQGIIHRDLKPANIKVRPDGTVKVLDFGLAKALDPAAASDAGAVLANSPTITSPAHTERGIILGTAAYMSPEQAKGRPVDKRSDMWAFGCVLYEMLTGTRAFAGEDVSDTLALILRGEPDWSKLPLDTPPAVRRLLRRALEKDRKRRIDSAADARLDVEEALASPPGADEAAAEPKAIPPAALKVWFAVIAAVCVAAITTAILLYERPSTIDTRLVKLSVAPPEGTTFDVVTVSPDGRWLAFTAGDASGKLKLWVRPLDSVDARALPGTEGAAFPFWSPDSQQLAFTSDGQLRKIAASGGPPQTICKGDSGRGAMWTRNGTIVFAGGSASPLMQVSADGGAPSPLTRLDPSKHETSHRWPQVLPDGRHFVFTIRSSESDVAGIYLGSVDSPSRSRLAVELSNAAYVTGPSGIGYLLFARGRSLLAQPLDLVNRRLTGEPTVVTENVWYLGERSRAAFSVSDTGVLVFDTVTRGRDTDLAWFDRTGARRGSFGQFSPTKISMSPDGAHLAVDNFEETGIRKIWTVDVARGNPVRFTSAGSASEETPLWSPDGTRIAFASDSAGIFERNAGGIGERSQLLKSDERLRLDDWSRDGRFLAYRHNASGDLTLLPMSGADRTSRSFGQTGNNLAFSPNSKWVAYDSDESGKREVYVRPLLQSGEAGSGKRRVSNGGGRYPRWRADGRELFYLADDLSALIAVPVASAAQFENGPPNVLFRGRLNTGIAPSFDVTPDGERFFIAAPVPADASTPVTVVLNWMSALKK